MKYIYIYISPKRQNYSKQIPIKIILKHKPKERKINKTSNRKKIIPKLKPEHKYYYTLRTIHLNNIINQEIPIIK
jgi:hypothetical protein